MNEQADEQKNAEDLIVALKKIQESAYYGAMHADQSCLRGIYQAATKVLGGPFVPVPDEEWDGD